MDFSGLILIGGILSYVGLTIYIANQIEAARRLKVKSPAGCLGRGADDLPESWLTNPTLMRWLQFGLVAMMFILGFTVFQVGMFSNLAGQLQNQLPQDAMPDVSVPAGAITFILAAAAGFASYRLIVSEEARLRLQRFLDRWGGHFDPTSQVHLTATILVLAFILWTVSNLILQGGVEGMAQDIQQHGIASSDVIFQGVLEVVITLLGVGLAIRRDIPETLARLGLRWPTREDLVWGVGIGLLLLITMVVFNLVWSALTSPGELERQLSAADQLSSAFSTLPLALLLAVSAALGEEIWIRGGLQPVFGLAASSLFFAVLHTQLALTPAMLFILIVSVGFGWLRQRHSTTAAIIAHFCFDFIQLALLALATEAI